MARVRRFLDTIQRLNADVNAFININSFAVEQGIESEERIKNNSQKSDIDGMVISVKDNIHVKGMPNTAGTQALRDFIPTENAPVVEKLLSAGGICIGKVNMEDMAFGITSYNPVYCQGGVKGVRNAHDHTKIAGGSSGGSAVSVAMEMCDVSLGSDTGGSVRIPAALNGVVGFRPSTGRYSSEGVTPISHTRDTIGILGGGVRDVQRVDSVISGDGIHALGEGDKIVVGYDAANSLANCSDEVLQAWNAVIETLKQDDRITLVPVDTTKSVELCAAITSPIVLHEAKFDLISYLNRYIPDVPIEELVDQVTTPPIKKTYAAIMMDHKAEYDTAMTDIRPKLIAEYRGLFEKINLIIAPTCPVTAMDADPDVLWTQWNEIFRLYVQNVDIASVVGSPSITIPVANPTGGLPVGLLIDGDVKCDSYVLAVARLLEGMLK